MRESIASSGVSGLLQGSPCGIQLLSRRAASTILILDKGRIVPPTKVRNERSDIYI